MDELLTVNEIMQALKISKKTAYNYIKSGQLPAVKLGHRYYVKAKILNEFFESGGPVRGYLQTLKKPEN